MFRPVALISTALFGIGALAGTPIPPPAPNLTWSVKSLFELENQITADNLLTQAQAQSGSAKTLADILAPVADSLSQVSSLDPSVDPQTVAITLFKASNKLTEAARQLRMQFPDLYATMNFLITPWSAQDPGHPGDLTLNRPNFAQATFGYMQDLQTQKYGRVEDGNDPLYLLGATAAIKLSAKSAVAHLQAVIALNPQTIDGQPKINIPMPMGKQGKWATVMYVDISQPLDEELPQVEIRFGRLGQLAHEGWLWRFEVAEQQSFCERTWSVPTILQNQPGVPFTIPLPLYDVKMNLNTQQITGVDVRLGLPGMCLKIGYIQNQFIEQANQQLAQAKTSLTKLLGASPDDFADIIKQQRKDEGISSGPKDSN